MQFIRTGKRAPKGLRTTEILEVPIKSALGQFTFTDPNTLHLTFSDGTQSVLVIQKATTYSVKKPDVDALSTKVAPPADNDEGDDAPPPLNPK